MQLFMCPCLGNIWGWSSDTEASILDLLTMSKFLHDQGNELEQKPMQLHF